MDYCSVPGQGVWGDLRMLLAQLVPVVWRPLGQGRSRSGLSQVEPWNGEITPGGKQMEETNDGIGEDAVLETCGLCCREWAGQRWGPWQDVWRERGPGMSSQKDILGMGISEWLGSVCLVNSGAQVLGRPEEVCVQELGKGWPGWAKRCKNLCLSVWEAWACRHGSCISATC